MEEGSYVVMINFFAADLKWTVAKASKPIIAAQVKIFERIEVYENIYVLLIGQLFQSIEIIC